VLGRRHDGYHDIVTILHEIDLHDEFIWTENGGAFEYFGPPGIDADLDLAARALHLAPDRDTWTGKLRLVKHIPLAAGLGGGSSNAATALRLALPESVDVDLHMHASMLGSDVPFFLVGGTALATGTGTTLTPLPSPDLSFVIVVPQIEIAGKTASMYGRLMREDFSEGMRTLAIAEAIRRNEPLPPRLPSTFQDRPPDAAAFHFAVQTMRDLLGRCTLSGAGPALFATYPNRSNALAAARLLPADIGRVLVSSSATKRVEHRLAELQRVLRGTMQG
jgi:4-diphosphocytidyl-2-C-methyl-D-erythritol kinase